MLSPAEGARLHESSQPERLPKTFNEEHPLGRETSAVALVFSIAVADCQQADDFHVGRRVNHVAHFLIFDTASGDGWYISS